MTSSQCQHASVYVEKLNLLHRDQRLPAPRSALKPGTKPSRTPRHSATRASRHGVSRDACGERENGAFRNGRQRHPFYPYVKDMSAGIRLDP